MQKKRLVATLLAAGLLVGYRAEASTWKIDQDHTTVTFRVRHMFTSIEGRFDGFEGTIVFDRAHPEEATVKGFIRAASINTNVAERDKHLRSAAFFDVAQYPRISFASSKLGDIDHEKMTAKLQGKLEIHGTERPVVLEVAFLGAGKDPWGNTKAGFRALTTINRKDFGLGWNEALEAGGFLVGDEVEIRVEAEAYLQE